MIGKLMPAKKSDRTQRYKGVPSPVARRIRWDEILNQPGYNAKDGGA